MSILKLKEMKDNSSGDDGVVQHFDKVEFMNKFHSRLMQIIDEGIIQLISQLTEDPAGKQCSKQLHEEKAMPPPNTIDANNVTR